jgi:hypothetical protein
VVVDAHLSVLDGGAGGSWTADLEWVDEEGTTRPLNGVPFGLTDLDAGKLRIPAVYIRRQSPTSLFRIVFTASGGVGSSKVGWGLWMNTDVSSGFIAI